MATFSVSEGNGPSEPVLRLSRPLDCCTISVRVDIQDDDAIGKQCTTYVCMMYMIVYAYKI